MKFGLLIDKINAYQALEKLLDEKSGGKDGLNKNYYWKITDAVRIKEEINEIIKKLEELREEEV